MKKLIFALASMLIALSSMAADGQGESYITKDFNLKDFTGISANSIIEVQLTKSNTYSVSVTLPKELEDYLDVRVIRGNLTLGMKQVPLKISKNYGKWNVTAKVTMPALYSLNLSGASKFECNDSFNLGEESFVMDMNGATKAEGLMIDAKEVEIEMSGAAVASLTGDFHVADIEMTGAAKGNFKINSDMLHNEVSGAAKAFHEGDFGKIEIETSGAGVFNMRGTAEIIELEASGAAKVETSKAEVKIIEASISGAAYCEVSAIDRLQVDASGGATMRYMDNDGMKLDIRSISRGASVSKMK